MIGNRHPNSQITKDLSQTQKLATIVVQLFVFSDEAKKITNTNHKNKQQQQVGGKVQNLYLKSMKADWSGDSSGDDSGLSL